MFNKQRGDTGHNGLSVRRVLSTALLLFLGISLPAALLAQSSTTAPSFQLNIALKADSGPNISLDWTKDLVISDTQPFFIQYRTTGSLWVYLIYEGNDGVVTWLDPKVWGKIDPNNPGLVRIPAAEYLTSSGNDPERMYLVVLPTRDQKFESSLTNLANLRSNASTRERNRVQNAVLDEIDRLRKEFSGLSREPEKPVAMAGTSRGVAPNSNRPSVGGATPPSFQYIEASIGQGYVKTIFIRKK